ncbi:MAG: hypothetical protein AAGM22_09215 [Acidobacteriota bacterium]
MTAPATIPAAASPATDPRHATLEDSWLFLHAATLAGEEGRAWADAFTRGPYLEGLTRVQAVLVTLRKGDFEAGRREVQDLEKELDHVDVDPSHRLVFERFYSGALAYLRFIERDFDGAVAALERGENAAVEVMDQHPFLVSLAIVFSDFTVQRARVARNRRDWDRLRELLETARGMVTGRRPLCTLSNGEPIFSKHLATFFDEIAVSQQDRLSVEKFKNPEVLWGRLETQVYQIPVPSGFVVPFQ